MEPPHNPYSIISIVDNHIVNLVYLVCETSATDMHRNGTHTYQCISSGISITCEHLNASVYAESTGTMPLVPDKRPISAVRAITPNTC
jgi:hypothetical protein